MMLSESAEFNEFLLQPLEHGNENNASLIHPKLSLGLGDAFLELLFRVL